MIQIIITAYLFVGFFLAGMYYGSEGKWLGWRTVAGMLIMLLFGLPMYVAAFAMDAIRWVSLRLQIRFWFRFYFTNKLDDPAKIDFKGIRAAMKHFKDNSVGDRMYRRAARALLKKHGQNEND